MSGFIFGILIPIFSLRPTNAQTIIDNNEGIWIGGTGCNEFKYIAGHNYKKLGKIILNKQKGDYVRFGGCRYKITNIQELPLLSKYKFNDMTYLQTCNSKSNAVYLYSLKNKNN